jgi:hypothetical protein
MKDNSEIQGIILLVTLSEYTSSDINLLAKPKLSAALSYQSKLEKPPLFPVDLKMVNRESDGKSHTLHFRNDESKEYS